MDINDFIIENGVLKKYNGNEKKVIIPNTVTEIGRLAFEHNYEINEIVIPASVSIIKSFAFSECAYLNKITIPKSVNVLEHNIFNKCINLDEVRIENPNIQIRQATFDNCYIYDLYIPKNINRDFFDRPAVNITCINGEKQINIALGCIEVILKIIICVVLAFFVIILWAYLFRHRHVKPFIVLLFMLSPILGIMKISFFNKKKKQK